jgi:hypothetical protein
MIFRKCSGDKRDWICEYPVRTPWFLGGDGMLTIYAESSRLGLTVECQCFIIKVERLWRWSPLASWGVLGSSSMGHFLGASIRGFNRS